MTAIDVYALPASPWKNGGGSTRTIAVSPAEAGFDDFDWRVSIADVASAGEFSRFPGVDRTILLLDGAGMVLHGDGGDVSLTTPFEPYAFRGDDLMRSTLVNGSTRDFNVMTRRGRAEARVSVSRVEFLLDAADDAVFFCPRGGYCIEGGEKISAGWAVRADRPTNDIRLVPQTADAVLIMVLIKQLESSR